MSAPIGPQTLVQPLFTPDDHTRILAAVQARAGDLVALLRARGEQPAPSQEQVLRATGELPGLEEKTRATVKQVLAFLPPLSAVQLDEAARKALASVEAELASAASIEEVALRLEKLRARTPEPAPGFAQGIKVALEIVRSGAACAAFGGVHADRVARACAHHAVAAAMAGAVIATGPFVAAVVGSIAASAQATVAMALEA